MRVLSLQRPGPLCGPWFEAGSGADVLFSDSKVGRCIYPLSPPTIPPCHSQPPPLCFLGMGNQSELIIEKRYRMDSERRQFTRFLAPDNTFAALGPSFTKVGRIRDIGISGLAFEYLTDDEPGLENSQVDIFIRDDEFRLSRLPCSIVYDIPVEKPADVMVSASRLIHKRCGIVFGRFTEIQKRQLENFIRIRTAGSANNKLEHE